MKIGMTQCAMWNSTLVDFLPAVGKAGYEVVELMVRGEGDLTIQAGDGDIRRVQDLAGAAGVKIFSLALLHLTAAPIDHGDARKQAVEQIAAGLRLARRLGAGYTLLTLGRLRPDLYYDDAYANGVSSLREVGRLADEMGVDVAVEFVWTGFLFSPLEMKRFLDDVSHPRVGFYFDPGNMAVFQYPQHWVRIVGKHTKLVHLKDWKGNALSGGWTALLEGQVDFPAVMGELRRIGYDGPLTSEVDPSLAPLEKTAGAIRKIMAMG